MVISDMYPNAAPQPIVVKHSFVNRFLAFLGAETKEKIGQFYNTMLCIASGDVLAPLITWGSPPGGCGKQPLSDGRSWRSLPMLPSMCCSLWPTWMRDSLESAAIRLRALMASWLSCQSTLGPWRWRLLVHQCGAVYHTACVASSW